MSGYPIKWLYAEPAGRCKTTRDELYVRHVWELNSAKISKRWIFLFKGGRSIRYFGNKDFVIDWSDEAKRFYAQTGGLPHERYWGKEGITWTFATSSEALAFRYKDAPCQYSTVSPTVVFENPSQLRVALCLLNGVIADRLLKILNPTLGLNIGDVLNIPLDNLDRGALESIARNGDELIKLAQTHWNSFETSFEFSALLLSRPPTTKANLSRSWQLCADSILNDFRRVRMLEEENNRFFIQAYNLQDELSPDVPEDHITLTRADREKDCQRLISYAIGCMMGRYSLDEPGLIYAHAGNVGFEPGRYATYPADADGIVPITDEAWFEDDAPSRIREYLRAVWGPDTLEENMAWLAESLGTKATETPDETIRRYLADKFFKDHLQTYKKRPIYWLFSSGKQGAFQALVYLHRYHEGTLARMRMEYLVPLQGKMAARIDRLVDDIASASTSAQAKRLQKERDRLTRQLDELRRFDEQLRHYADQRIALDLDDGVKVNYAKFGNLLAEVKTVTGTNPD